MRKSTRIIKKLLAIFLVVLISIESFAAVVSDNDGSAFVTKAEFEALKENFAEQIENYNTSIDSKIDGAVASYLAGMKLEKTEEIDSLLYKANSIKNVKFTKNWIAPTTQIGDKCEVSEMLWFIYQSIATNGTNTWSGCLGAMEVQSGPRATIFYHVLGSTSSIISQPGYNRIYNKYYIDNESFWEVIPNASAWSMDWHNCFSSVKWNPSDLENDRIEMEGLTELKNQNANFGTKVYTYANYVNCKYGGDRRNGVKMNYITGYKEKNLGLTEVTNGKNTNCLSGGAVSGVVKSTLSKDWNITEETSFKTFDLDTNIGWQEADEWWHSTNTGTNRWWHEKITGEPTMHIYQKKNTDLTVSELIHNGWTNATDCEVKYYTGIPLFKAISNGVIELPLRFVVDGTSGGASFEIKNAPFSNASDLDASTISLYEDKECNIGITNKSFTGTSYDKKIYFQIKSGDTYWIKVKPNSDNDVTLNSTTEKLKCYIY